MDNKKGFTLIELLAVIVILGLLIAIAIPSITRYITQSRKKTLLNTVDSYTNAVVNGVNNMEYGSLSSVDSIYYIPIECVSLEKGGADPFGEWKEAYVAVVYRNDIYSYDYYFTFYDSAGYGMELTKIEDIDKSLIKNPTTINADTIKIQTINGKTVQILDKDTCNSSNTTSYNGESSSNNGEEQSANYIYWALQDNDGNGTNETLVLSDVEVNGIYDGNIENDATFSSYTSVPWIAGAYSTTNNLSYNVSNILVNGNISPKEVKNWFYGVGYNASTFQANLSNINTSNVTNMSDTFHYMGYKAGQFNLNISNWNTANVTNMSYMFSNAGLSATSFNLDLSNLNTSNVTNMSYMLNGTGRNTTNWSLGNINNWNTSNVTNMSHMFYYAGTDATNFRLNISNWDTSNVTNMNQMFGAAGMGSTSFILDLSTFNTSSVTNMSGMFYNTAVYAKTFNLNLSHFNTSNVTNISQMFAAAGRNATTSFKIIIPRRNGGNPGINNTTSTMYGKTTSITTLATESKNNRSFTLAS